MASERLWRSAALVAALLGTSVASAQEQNAGADQTSAAEGPSAADRETARQLMDAGNAKYRDGDYAGALEDYRAADRIMHVTSTGLNMGKALIMLGKLVEARDKLLEVMRIPTDPNESPVLTRAREEARRLQVSVADRIPALKIEVTGIKDMSRLSVRIGDEEIPKASLSLPRRVNPGEHIIRAEYPGSPVVELKVLVDEKEVRSVKIELNPVDAGEPIEDGDGSGGDEGLGVHPLAWVGFGLAGAGVIAGAVTGGLSLKDASTAKEGCVETRCPPGNEDIAKRSTTLAHVSTASFVVAGAGAVLGVTALLLLGKDDSDAAALRLRVGPTGVALAGRF